MKLDSIWLLIQVGQLAAKEALKRISRNRGKELLNKAIEAARQVNEGPDLTFRVSKLILFGSHITVSETVSDVDIVCVTTPIKLPGESRKDFMDRDAAYAGLLGIPPTMMGIRSCQTYPKNQSLFLSSRTDGVR